MQVGQGLADPQAARGELGLIQRQPAARRHRSRLRWRLEPAASVGAVDPLFVFPPGLHHRGEREQAPQGEEVGDDQEEIKRHAPGKLADPGAGFDRIGVTARKSRRGTLSEACVGS
jgi:hypothetical protein